MAKVLALNPDEKTSLIKKAQILFDADKVDKAAEVVEEYMVKHPDDAQALVLMACIMKRIGKPAIAYPLAKRATECSPHRSETWCQLGRAAQDLWHLEESLQAYKRALSLATNANHKALYKNNIGSIYLDQGKFGEAEEYFRDSIKLDADEWRPKHNLALSLLARGQWVEGWENYSASMGTHARLVWKYRKPPNEEPTWDGTKGQRVIVFGEQGLGDEICFASMIPDAAKDARIIIDCERRLAGLFRRSFPKCKVYGTRNEKNLAWDEEDREFDASISSAEIGKFYRTTNESFPVKPYLVPDLDRKIMWQALWAKKNKPVIGIAWSGGTFQNGSMLRYAELESWLPLFKSFDAHWVSLQYKQTSEVNKFKFLHPDIDLAEYPFANFTQDYDDTAALIASLDCVVSVPTTVVHAAGALGVPTVMMKFCYQCWKTAAGIPFHPTHKIIDWQGSWKASIAATIPYVQEILCAGKYSSATIHASR
jgi:tetratricopeptide (TPR) repeat protein